MKGFVENIEDLSVQNNNFRKVIYTGKYCQLVLMSLLPGEDIGEEIHQNTDQFLRIEQGMGQVMIDGISHDIKDDFAIVVPAGSKHNVINTGTTPMKIYTIYTPPHHKEAIVHQTKEIAESDTTDEFDGKTTE